MTLVTFAPPPGWAGYGPAPKRRATYSRSGRGRNPASAGSYSAAPTASLGGPSFHSRLARRPCALFPRRPGRTRGRLLLGPFHEMPGQRRPAPPAAGPWRMRALLLPQPCRGRPAQRRPGLLVAALELPREPVPPPPFHERRGRQSGALGVFRAPPSLPGPLASLHVSP